ncbi:hypothetical protein [uncultured Algibacter sp.]|uniref:hypothetical protein n=1 Tax=uncultured Algibacter sp. TaxID=298659 RepID=UPI0026118E18|nr:hypothetical protein [uncultured Algibacter sp.]
MKHTLFTLCLIALLMGCKTTSINKASHETTIQRIPICSIGLDKDVVLQTAHNNVAWPVYNAPIKLVVEVVPFSQQTYKSFLNASAVQFNDIRINYVDSLESKPEFVTLKLIDKIAVLKALNTKENKSVKDYLSLNPSANIVTSVSLAFNEEQLKALKMAESVFLIEHTPKTYALELYSLKNEKQIISFNQGVAFAFKKQNCCWQEDKAHHINIVDFVQTNKNCPNKTYRKAKKAKTKVNIYKL